MEPHRANCFRESVGETAGADQAQHCRVAGEGGKSVK